MIKPKANVTVTDEQIDAARSQARGFQLGDRRDPRSRHRNPLAAARCGPLCAGPAESHFRNQPLDGGTGSPRRISHQCPQGRRLAREWEEGRAAQAAGGMSRGYWNRKAPLDPSALLRVERAARRISSAAREAGRAVGLSPRHYFPICSWNNDRYL